jgi:hypothetical protein
MIVGPVAVGTSGPASKSSTYEESASVVVDRKTSKGAPSRAGRRRGAASGTGFCDDRASSIDQ